MKMEILIGLGGFVVFGSFFYWLTDRVLWPIEADPYADSDKINNK